MVENYSLLCINAYHNEICLLLLRKNAYLLGDADRKMHRKFGGLSNMREYLKCFVLQRNRRMKCIKKI